jgi:hypothetical protein
LTLAEASASVSSLSQETSRVSSASSIASLSTEELNAVFKAAALIPNAMRAARDLAVLAIMVDTKMASQKIANLKFENVSLILQGHNKIQDPKKAESYIPVSPNTAVLIRNWVAEVNRHDVRIDPKEFPLFFSLKSASEDSVRNVVTPDKLILKRDSITKIFLCCKTNSGIMRLTRNLLATGDMENLDLDGINVSDRFTRRALTK